MTSRVDGEREKTAFDLCLDGVYELKSKVETSPYGKNKTSVRAAITEQTLLQKQIDDYDEEVQKMLKQTDDEVQQQSLKDAYQKLKDVSEQKQNCLNTLLEIATLEEHCANLGETFDRRAVKLVNPDKRKEDAAGDNLQGFMAPSSQDCVFATEDNWTYLTTLVKCIDTHLKNGAQYQQFFHECDESGVWMESDLKRLQDVFELSELKGDYQEANRLTQELSDLLLALKQWSVKTDYLWELARRVVPVQARVTPTDQPLPARALCNYQTQKGKIRENEDLLVIDNTDTQHWTVRNARGDEFTVPALTILIPGPFKEAIEAAVNMRLKLLAVWTNLLKRVGHRLISFMLMVFKSTYQEDEIKTLRSIPSVEKNELWRVLDYVEDTLKVHWSDHNGFQALQERVLMLRMMLEETDDNDADEETYKSLVVQIMILEKLMQKYKDMWLEWEKYKTALEASRAPELMLVVDKWEQLKFVSRDYFTKFWQNNLPLEGLQTLKITDVTDEMAEAEMTEAGMSEEGFTETGSSTVTTTTTEVQEAQIQRSEAIQAQSVAPVSSFEEGMFEERVEETTASFTEHSANVDEVEGSEFGMATERKVAETEQLSKAEKEETKRFVIRSVVNPLTDEEISLDAAIIEGLIKPDEGIYLNKKTGESYPIPVAMGAGLIKVDFTTTKRTQEKKSSIGIITVKTIRETVRPYTIEGVKDTITKEDVDKEEAIKRGIINEAKGTFSDKLARRNMLISEAIEQGLVQVKYEGEAPEPEVIAQSYAVRAVVDTRSKSVITFGEAVRRGIIDRDSGSFKDLKTGETMYVGDAIMRGFLKARKIDDPNNLNIDPENQMLVDKTEKIRQKLIRPLRVIGAFRKAALLAANNK